MDMNVVIASVLNFSIVLFIFIFFGRKPFAKFLLTRSEALKTSIDQSEKSVEQARKELLVWEQNWSEAQGHAKQNHIDCENSMKRLREKTLADAKHEAERISKEAELMSSGEILKAKRELQKDAIKRSVELAELYLGEHLSGQDKHKLVTEFVELVGHGTR